MGPLDKDAIWSLKEFCKSQNQSDVTKINYEQLKIILRQLFLVWFSILSESELCISSSDIIETDPLGPITSLIKKAVSLIIGPHAHSYHPTDPSANLICNCP